LKRAYFDGLQDGLGLLLLKSLTFKVSVVSNSSTAPQGIFLHNVLSKQEKHGGIRVDRMYENGDGGR
jgi:hypothetical protein